MVDLFFFFFIFPFFFFNTSERGEPGAVAVVIEMEGKKKVRWSSPVNQ